MWCRILFICAQYSFILFIIHQQFILFPCEGCFSLTMWAGIVANLVNVLVNLRGTFACKGSLCTPAHAEPLCPDHKSISDTNGQICHILGKRVKKGINAVGHFVSAVTKSFCFSTLHLHLHKQWYKPSQRGKEGPAGEAGTGAPVSFHVFLGAGKGRNCQPNWRRMPFTSLLPWITAPPPPPHPQSAFPWK